MPREDLRERELARGEEPTPLDLRGEALGFRARSGRDPTVPAIAAGVWALLLVPAAYSFF